MIKKILLLAVTALSVVACSKDDNNSKGGNAENKIVGTWVGTSEVTAENPKNQDRILQLLKEQYNLLKGITQETEFGKWRIVIDDKTMNFFDNSGKVKVLEEMKYSIKGNQIINNESGQAASYSLNGNHLTIEPLHYTLPIIDTENMQKALSEETEKFTEELEKSNLSPSDPLYQQKIQEKISELTGNLLKKYTFLFKYKWNLTHQ